MKNFDDKYPILKKINSPSDIDSSVDLKNLCAEIRKKIIEVVSKNGGYLSSNLGVVELTVSLFKAFDFKKDKIVWDVGHQSYIYKILTGRKDDFKTHDKGVQTEDGDSFPVTEHYICPICLETFNLNKLGDKANDLLTVEDVPPNHWEGIRF